MLIELINHTPFTAESFVLPDVHGQETLLVVLVATFVAAGHGTLQLAEQRPVRVADTHFGDAAHTSVQHEAELALEKPQVDVLLQGNAHAPGGKPARSVDVSLKLAGIDKTLRVQGDRVGQRQPEPFLTMPIVYERAFGGIAGSHAELRNPIGIGYRGARSAVVASELPNVQYPGRSEEPAGFGPLARGWKPRIDLAGTYDDTWLAERAPLPPLDYRPTHAQAAPLDQRLASVSGGETVTLQNLTVSGLWRFRVPRLDIPVAVLDHQAMHQGALHLDTIAIEPEFGKVTLTARLCRPLPRGPNPLRAVVLGHVRKAGLTALFKRKRFLDQRSELSERARLRCFQL